jgi:hypothetical protein
MLGELAEVDRRLLEDAREEIGVAEERAVAKIERDRLARVELSGLEHLVERERDRADLGAQDEALRPRDHVAERAEAHPIERADQVASVGRDHRRGTLPRAERAERALDAAKEAPGLGREVRQVAPRRRHDSAERLEE